MSFLGRVHLRSPLMRFKIPGHNIHVRLFEPVVTADEQYQVYDTGVEYESGGIDSVAVGGSFYSLKELARKADENADKATATA